MSEVSDFVSSQDKKGRDAMASQLLLSLLFVVASVQTCALPNRSVVMPGLRCVSGGWVLDKLPIEILTIRSPSNDVSELKSYVIPNHNLGENR